MTISLIIIIAVFAWNPLRAQGQCEDWKAYTSMREINHLLVHGDAVWSATSGGVLRFDQSSQSYTRYTVLDGLAGNKVLSVAADDRGHLWFGTHLQGLSRFRTSPEGFDPPFLDFKDLDIYALKTMGDRIFVGTGRGVSVFLIDKEEVKETYRQLGTLPKDTPVNTLEVVDGRLVAGTVAGLAWADLSLPNLQDPESWKNFTAAGTAEDLMIVSDTLYTVTPQGVWRFDPDSDRFVHDSPNSSANDAELSSLGIFRGKVIASNKEGYFYQRHGAGHWSLSPTRAIPKVRALSRVDTVLWIATSQGLRVVGTVPPPPPREPTANRFYEMELLDSGELWVASVPSDFIPPHGLYHFDGTGWTVYGLLSGLPTEVVVSVEVNAEGRLWVGTWGKGVAVLDKNEEWMLINQNNSVLQGLGPERSFVAVSDIERDEDGLMWINNVQIGLAVMDGLDPSRATLYDQKTLGISGDISKLTIASDGIKWISTYQQGFLLFDDGGTPFTIGDEHSIHISTGSESRLSSDRIADIAVDSGGRVWVATNNGLNVLSGTYSRENRELEIDDWRIYTTEDGLPSNEIKAVEEGRGGSIWVGTEGGLAQIEPDGTVAFSFTTGNSCLVDNRINSLLFDDANGELWIGTLDGLSRLKAARGRDEDSAVLGIYPNPFVLGSPGAEMVFAGLPLGASLRIFSLGGEMVWHGAGTPGSSAIAWNGQNASGFLVGSGIYFFVARDESGAGAKGKFAVINPR